MSVEITTPSAAAPATPPATTVETSPVPQAATTTTQVATPAAGETKTAAGAPPAPLLLVIPKDSLLEASASEKTAAEATALGLSPEQAQKMLEGKSAAVSEFMKGQEEKFAKLTRTDWPAQIKADPDFGGEKYAETVALAKKAFDRFGDPELANVLNVTGYGNHPLLLKWAARVGRAMAEDRVVVSRGGGPAGGKSIEEMFYGGAGTPA